MIGAEVKYKYQRSIIAGRDMGRYDKKRIIIECLSPNKALIYSIVEHEKNAYEARCNYISRDLFRNIPWSILIQAAHAELRSEEFLVEHIARHEEVTEILILRWAKVMVAQELISIRTNAHGKAALELQVRGRKEIDEYLTRLWKQDE